MMTKTKQLSLKLQGISKEYRSDLLTKNRLALDHFTHDFKAGTVSAIMGHNGAGKTTLMRIIMGLVKADSGEIFLGEERLSAKHRSVVGYMPENDKIQRELRVREILTFQYRLFEPRVSTKEQKSLVNYILSECDLLEYSDVKIKNLSKGLARKLAWGLSIIHNPQILILDEPFSGLDPLGQDKLKDAIIERQKLGTTILVSTHSLSMLNNVANDILILNCGSKVYDGPASESLSELLPLFKRFR